MSRLSRSLRDVSPAAAMVLSVELRVARDDIAKKAKANASFSQKIPGSIRGTGSGVSLKVSAGGSTAPDAAPFENRGKSGNFRHPVFGHTDRWVSQAAHPFLTPAAREGFVELAARIDVAIDKALAVIGGE
jgi:hypothetical protein